MKNLTLIISDKPDLERDAVASAWQERGGDILRLGRFWDPPKLDSEHVRLYGADSFCQVLAQKLGLHLTSPDDALLCKLNKTWLKRDLRSMKLKDAAEIQYPIFIKSLVPKIFRAAVYENHDELLKECKGLENDTEIYVSEIVSIECEARSFILNGRVESYSIYEGNPSISGGEEHLEKFLASNASFIPSTCVLDIAHFEGKGWGLLEANASWGAGLNGCDARAVIDCIEKATTVK